MVTLATGLILVTLAVREAEREKLSRERDLAGEQQRYAALLSGEIGSLFTGIEERFSADVEEFRTGRDLQMLAEACRRSAEGEDLIGDIFLAGSDGDWIFLLKDPLFFASERRRLAKINLDKLEGKTLFRNAESAELDTADFAFSPDSRFDRFDFTDRGIFCILHKRGDELETPRLMRIKIL